MVKPTLKPSLRERFNISRLAIQYSWLTLGFWIAVIVAGTLAFSSLKYALFPDITFPVVVVTASAPNQTALETESELTQPIEAQMQNIAGLAGTGSLTYPGQSVVTLDFEVGTNLEAAEQAVESALAALELPDSATFNAIPINLNEAAVVSYALQSDSQSLEELSKTTETLIIPAITAIPGVLKVNLLGEPVEFDLSALAQGAAGLNQAGTRVRLNGEEAVAIQVIKRGDANTLEVVRAVEAEIQQLRSQFPDLTLTLAATQADYIQAATSETIQALIEAIVLSIVVIFPFLWNWRATLISALAIPISLLGTFIVMAIYGFNLETLTLLALAMVIGSIVDDAIVDVENISRHLEQGESPKQAAILATNEIGLTVTAATLTAVCVFLPVGLMGGVLGQFFKPFGITIAAAMLTSMMVARTLSPLLAAYWLKPNSAQKRQNWTYRAQHWLDGVNHHYRQLLRWSLRHRSIVIGIALLSFIGGLALIPLIPKGFIPKLDRGEFNVTYTAPLPEVPPELLQALSGSQPDPRQNAAATGAASERNAIAERAANQRQRPQVNLPDFDPLEDSLAVAESLDSYILQSSEVQTVFTTVGSRQGEPNKGTIYVRLKDDRTNTTAAVQDEFRQNLPQRSGVVTSVEDIQFVDTGGEKPMQIRLVGEDLAALNQTAQELKQKLEEIPGFEDVSATGEVNTGDNVVEIKRSNGQRIAIVSANLGQGLTLGDATDRAVAEAEAILPPGLSLDLGGDSARVNEILGSFGATLTLSVLCILLVLLFLFRSWIDTLVIFLSLPLSIIGAMVGLLIVQSDFGMISLIGIIFLLGLTNKNAILIVDYIKQLRHSGMNRRDAILEAAPVRLRPILMTTAATILGMLPIALGLGAGAELRAPMAVAIMGGLVTSTLLSLIVVPVIYDLLDDWQSRWRRRA
jgi:multidrug efflux pump subunit AcrB